MRLTGCPVRSASSRQRCNSFNNAGASASSFLSGWRLGAGTSAATSHFGLLILVKSGEGTARVQRMGPAGAPSDGDSGAPKDAIPSPLASYDLLAPAQVAEGFLLLLIALLQLRPS